VIKTPLGKNDLLLSGFSGREAISQPFLFQLECVAENATKIPFDGLLGQKITAEISLPGGSKRWINGVCFRVAQGARDATFTRYLLDLVPAAFLLSRKTQSRIFQEMSVPDILREVLKGVDGLDVTWEIQGVFEPRDYCVQYRESDFAFASRLMEEEGIYYFFKHADGSHKMVVANTPGSHSDISPGPSKLIFEAVGGGTREEDRVSAWEKAQELRSSKVTLWDHCFELPHKHLEAPEAPVQIQASVAAGKSSHKLQLAANAPLELYDYPGAYAQRFDGVNKSGGEQPAEINKIFKDNSRTTDLRAQAEASASVLVHAASNCRQVVSGHKFTLLRHFEGDGSWVVYQVGHTASEAADVRSDSGGFTYQNHFSCFPADLPFRPPRVTPIPVVKGTQTAVVVGPPGEEIFTDKYGRIKVQFHWDREGEYNSDSSCWIRVATPWAGHRWGAIHVPRIGQEVVVDFLEGDMDQPIVIGSLYNADCMPPYELPKYKTYSTMKSRSTKDGGNLDFNELRYVDTKGKEQVFIHAQRRMDVRVKRNMYETIGGSRNTCIGGEYAVTVGGSHDLHVKKDVFFRGDGKIEASTGGAVSVNVGGASKYYAKASNEINALSTTIESMKSVVLKVGGSFIEVSPMGITIQGPLVRINSGGAAAGTAAFDTDDPLDCEGADTGEPGYLDRPYKGGGGGRKKRHCAGYHARAVTYDPAKNTFTYGGSGIAVTGSPDFADKTLQTLAGIDATPTGHKLIDNLQSNKHTVTIKEATPAEAAASGGGECTGNSWNVVPAGNYTDSSGNPVTSNGKGDDSEVKWQPGYNAQYNVKDPATGATRTETQPDEALLGHELNHADHNARGNNLSQTPDPKDSTGDQEESQTIGINDHKNADVSENNLLKDLGQDWQRTDHDSNAVPLTK
jgi:type VI secretion system secreted protein VgrG